MFKRIRKQQVKRQRSDGAVAEDFDVLDDDDSQTSTSSDDDSQDNDVPLEGVQDNSSFESGDDTEVAYLSVQQALSDPIAIQELDPECRSCVICPGVNLKNSKMVQDHLESKSHNRRFTRLSEYSQAKGPTSLPEALGHLNGFNPASLGADRDTTGTKSGRALKRENYGARRREQAASRKLRQNSEKGLTLKEPKLNTGDNEPTDIIEMTQTVPDTTYSNKAPSISKKHKRKRGVR